MKQGFFFISLGIMGLGSISGSHETRVTISSGFKGLVRTLSA